MRRFVLAAFALTMFAACSTPEPMSEARHRLVGTWKLVEWRNQDSLGVSHERFGSEPRGLIVYTASGHLSIHLMHEDGKDVSNCEPLTDALLVNSACYGGYFGTYRIEQGDSVVVHEPIGGTYLSYIETDQRRKFEVVGDSLWLGWSDTIHRLFLRVD